MSNIPSSTDYGCHEGDVVLDRKSELKEPKKYVVLFHNDDYTPFVFVEYALVQYFGYDQTKAHDTAIAIHNNGMAVVGVYTKDIAETKADQVMSEAIINDFPLIAEVAPES